MMKSKLRLSRESMRILSSAEMASARSAAGGGTVAGTVGNDGPVATTPQAGCITDKTDQCVSIAVCASDMCGSYRAGRCAA